jgi:hypothetical protein
MLKKLQNRNGDKEHDVYDLGWVCVVFLLMAKTYRRGGDPHSEL